MLKNPSGYESFGNEKVGVVTNYFSEQILMRDYKVITFSYDNYKSVINKHNISSIFIDSHIYEKDHEWYDKDLNGLIAFINESNISVFVIKNNNKILPKILEGYFIWDIDNKKLLDYSSAKLTTNMYFNEYLFNPISLKKSYDVLYLSFSKLNTLNILSTHSNNQDKSVFFSLADLTRKDILELILKMKKSKIMYIFFDDEIDHKILENIQHAAVFFNCIVVQDSKFTLKSNLTYNYNNDSYNSIFINSILESELFYDKTSIAQSRKAFLKHSLMNIYSLPEILQGNYTKQEVEISVITSSIRKDNLLDYIIQLNSQNKVKFEVILLTHGFQLLEDEKNNLIRLANFDIKIINENKDKSLGYCLNKCLQHASREYVTKMDDDDFYYENYLIDLWIAIKFSKVAVVGKGAHFMYLEKMDTLLLRQKSKNYEFVSRVTGSSLFTTLEFLRSYSFSNLNVGEDTDFFERVISSGEKIFATHPYEACFYRSKDKGNHTWKIKDFELMKSSKVVSYGNPKLYLSTTCNL